ncbi:MAG: type II toxin-antitoxin system HipA family toxin YjjJ [Gammaproteobacteria bacterium]|nr:type II toxin-antitoxin system HipA family toxin YjjJ [Gammaproteobacteria bacterium]
MQNRLESIRRILAREVSRPAQLRELLGVSQPTLSRAISEIKDEIVSIGRAKSIQYALRNIFRGQREEPVYRVTELGDTMPLGTLIPIHPEGFVMKTETNDEVHDGLPWWLFDMKPQGYLGRAYAAAYAEKLGLGADPRYWSDADIIKALVTHGQDAVGNLILGEVARETFMSLPAPREVNDRKAEYLRMAGAVRNGEQPGSSAGGEQPKFCAFTDHGHVIVKFTVPAGNQISERWADLLLAEHIALDVLGVQTYVYDFDDQRFLEIPRFDRVGTRGRVGMFSLEALNLQFVGARPGPWPSLVKALVEDGHVKAEAAEATEKRWAFGRLIGNTDMHNGNLSFIGSNGRPYSLSPAYDILPMYFAPKSSGEMMNTLAPITISNDACPNSWRDALANARLFIARAMIDERFSSNFRPCLEALARNIDQAAVQIGELP